MLASAFWAIWNGPFLNGSKCSPSSWESFLLLVPSGAIPTFFFYNLAYSATRSSILIASVNLFLSINIWPPFSIEIPRNGIFLNSDFPIVETNLGFKHPRVRWLSTWHRGIYERGVSPHIDVRPFWLFGVIQIRDQLYVDSSKFHAPNKRTFLILVVPDQHILSYAFSEVLSKDFSADKVDHVD